MKIKGNLADIIFFTAIASTTLYIVSGNLPFGLGSFRFLWGPLSLIAILVFRPLTFIQGPAKIIVFYGLLFLVLFRYTLWNYQDDWLHRPLLNEFYALLLVSLILTYYTERREHHKLAMISKWTFLFIIVTAISTNIVLSFEPNIVRSAANSFRWHPHLIDVQKRFGTAGFGYAQGMVILLPIIVIYIRTKQKIFISHRGLIIVLLLLIVLIVRANVFANFLVATPILLLSLYKPKNENRALFLVLSLIIAFAITPSALFSQWFWWSSSFFEPDSFLHMRLADFAIFLDSPEIEDTAAAGRFGRVTVAYQALLSSPLLGDASYDSPYNIKHTVEHLYWLGRLASWGLLGFLIFVFLLYNILTKIIKLLDSDFRYYYFLSVLAFISLGMMKNISGREPWLFILLIIPGLGILHKMQKTANVRRNKPAANKSDLIHQS